MVRERNGGPAAEPSGDERRTAGGGERARGRAAELARGEAAAGAERRERRESAHVGCGRAAPRAPRKQGCVAARLLPRPPQRDGRMQPPPLRLAAVVRAASRRLAAAPPRAALDWYAPGCGGAARRARPLGVSAAWSGPPEVGRGPDRGAEAGAVARLWVATL